MQILLAIGLYSLFFTLVALLLFGLWAALLPWSMKPLFKILLWPRYGIYKRGLENVPRTGPLLLAGNHVSWIDGFVIASVCPRPITVLVNKDYCDNPGQRWLARRMNVIPIPSSGPKAQRAALETMRKALDEGRTVGLFPEAQLCRSGMMNPFLRGFEMILKDKPDVLVVPVGVAGIWGSIFSFSGGLFFKKWPRGLRRRIGVSFGPPLPPTIKAADLRQHVLEEIVQAARMIPTVNLMPDQIDLELGHWRHPQFGLLTASAADFIQPNRRIHQVANKPGSVGQAVPGVAIRVVDESGQPLPPGSHGRLEALGVDDDGWRPTGQQGRLEADGYVWLDDPTAGHITTAHKEFVKIVPEKPAKNGSAGKASQSPNES
jgi:1-acyl-sn-glycerol-3-phosphate acyltransferase